MKKLARLLIAGGISCLIGQPCLAQTKLTIGAITKLPAPAPVATTAHASPTTTTTHNHLHKTRTPFLPMNERFSNLGQAKSHCPAGGVVWASMHGSPLYHDAKSRWFGRTKHGVYACKSVLDKAGFRLGK